MNRLVYLFELDSVNKYALTEDACVTYTPAMKALFNEIISNGNCVAISMNQLTDSQFIKEMLKDEFAYSCLLKLFENGAIKVSLYDNICSASQYVQNAIKKCLSDTKETFIFSNLPIKNTEEQLLATVRNALEFSTLTEIKELIDSASTEEKERFVIIYRFVYVILQVSICENSYTCPKKEAKRKLEEYIAVAIRLLKTPDFYDIEEREQIVEYLNGLNDEIREGRNNRSNWLNYSATENYVLTANRIINLCYNYTIEDSILGVTRHYDYSDFNVSFAKDFRNRLLISLSEQNTIAEKNVSKNQWKALVRFSGYIKNLQENPDSYKPVTDVYEKQFHQEHRMWVQFVAKQNLHAVIMSVFYILIFAGIELVVDLVKDVVSSIFVSAILTFFLFSVVGSLIGRCLKKINHDKDFPDILEGFINVGISFYDIYLTLGEKNDSYRAS